MAPEAEYRWYSPEEAWPSHQNQAVEEALSAARLAGWWYRLSTGHGRALVFCRRTHDRECCYWPVWSTGKSPEGPARSLRRMLVTCPHRSVEADSTLDEVQRLLDAAERILAVGKSLLLRIHVQQQSEDALAAAEKLQDQVLAGLAVAERSVREIEELMTSAVDWDAQAHAAREGAAAGLASLGLVDLEVVSVPDLAQAQVTQAEVLLDDVPQRRSFLSDVRNRIDAAKGQISLIRAAIASRSDEASG